MTLVSVLLGFTLTLAKPSEGTHPLPEHRFAGVNKTLLLQLVNDVRKKGCKCGDTWYPSAPPVAWNELLEKAALNHSTDMNRNGFFSHTSPTNGKAGPRLEAIGYNWRTYGENIAMGYESEKEVVAGWLTSPGHCKNIMNPSYKEMGVAKVGNLWTQDFGTR
ncbi:CAP domain-containing protein [Flavisolibacter ginsenosidimutans]|uniref:CAP domain-containing protein n=1 Tax=Flavisolibacter ginsenosidimutans TaxID=661481 RepID=A0A5B8UFS2_9BACT|nr:CAP domain-containing protein [Flavisolibacter ginsenosidimutans]QEC55156.1 CAP domain-containing protein [Flavisolibacter ginsenosidimutans]